MRFRKKTDNAIRYINNNLSREEVARIIIDLNFE